MTGMTGRMLDDGYGFSLPLALLFLTFIFFSYTPVSFIALLIELFYY